MRLALGEVGSLGLWERMDEPCRSSGSMRDQVARQREDRDLGFLGEDDLWSSVGASSDEASGTETCECHWSRVGWWSFVK